MTGLRHASISEMSNMKRSTINIKALELVAEALEVKSIDELLIFSNSYSINYIPENKWFAEGTSGESGKFIRWRNTIRGIVVDAIELDDINKAFYHSTFTYEDISYYELTQKFNSLGLDEKLVDKDGILTIVHDGGVLADDPEESEFYVFFNLCDSSSTHKRFNYPDNWKEKRSSSQIDEELLKQLEL